MFIIVPCLYKMLTLREGGGRAYRKALYYFCNFFVRLQLFQNSLKRQNQTNKKHFLNPTSPSSLYLFPFLSSFPSSSCSHFPWKQLTNDFHATQSNRCPPVPILTSWRHSVLWISPFLKHYLLLTHPTHLLMFFLPLWWFLLLLWKITLLYPAFKYRHSSMFHLNSSSKPVFKHEVILSTSTVQVSCIQINHRFFLSLALYTNCHHGMPIELKQIY